MSDPAADPDARWPYLTADVSAVPGAIKRRWEDFRVEEIPRYEPSGDGDHVFFCIEKAGLPTLQAVADIARALGVSRRDVGMAGLKDTRAIARQVLSVEHVEPDRILALDIPRIRVLWARRNRKKLRVGHLRGNRFTILLRDAPLERVDDVRRLLDRLTRVGVPNYFGAQRFGNRGDTGWIGKAVLAGDWATAAELVAGRPGPHDVGDVRRARELFQAGRYADAANAWPARFPQCVRLSRAMAREGGDARRAFPAVGKRLLRFYVSAYQSWLFNEVLARRIDGIDRVLTGDLAQKHDTGGIFLVEDAAVEQERADRFEISATGPLFGRRMREPEGRPARIETDVLRAEAVARDAFDGPRPVRMRGGRRSLRFRPDSAAAAAGRDDRGPFIELRFTLPSGCYATTVLREICKDRLERGPDADTEHD